jgi:ABC-type sugar transport system permease subunit/ABC-type glycerol-3-phosphate transport system substrate-binding protein
MALRARKLASVENGGPGRPPLPRSVFGWSTALLALALPLHATELDIPIRAGGYGVAFYEQTARQFEALRPGVQVHLYGDPRIEDKVRVRVIDGNFPDAAFTPYLLWPALIRAHKVLDLTPYLDGPNWENDARWRDTFYPGALDSWKLEGRTYAVPLNYSCWTIFYNRKLFRAHGWREQPRTWEEFFALCDKISASGVAPVATTGVYGNYPDAFLRAAAYNLLGAEGWRRLNDLAPGARDDPRYIKAAALLQRIAQRYTLRGWEGMTHTAAQVAFLEGRAAMTVSGSWMIREMEGKIPDDFEIGVMPFPAFADGVSDPATIQVGADSFFVFATGDPERERLTIDFLRFLTSRARALAFVRQIDSPVAVRGVPVEAFSPRMRVTAAMIEQAHEAFHMPQVMMQPPALRQAMIDGRKQLMLGALTPAEFARQLEAAAENDRRRAAHPEAVEYRHVFGGCALLLGLATLAGWFLWKKAAAVGASRARKDTRPDLAAASGDTSYFGRLRARVGIGFVGPALLLYGGLVVLPGLAAFAWAFVRWDGIGPRTWAGVFNFKSLLFESDLFWTALRNNVYLMVVPAAVVVPTALLFAALIHRGIWGGKVFRVVLLFPNMLGGIAAALLWLNAYEPHGGLVNAGLVALGRTTHNGWLQSFDGYPWLAQSHLYAALIPIYLWMACGFNLILYLAAMEGIDPQLYEAADLDGASASRQFFTITLPLIWEVIVISAVFLVIAGLNAFEMVWLLTSQDPESSVHTLGTLMVTAMFKNFQIGQATAIAVILFVLVLATSAFVMRALKRERIEQ